MEISISYIIKKNLNYCKIYFEYHKRLFVILFLRVRFCVLLKTHTLHSFVTFNYAFICTYILVSMTFSVNYTRAYDSYYLVSLMISVDIVDISVSRYQYRYQYQYIYHIY